MKKELKSTFLSQNYGIENSYFFMKMNHDINFTKMFTFGSVSATQFKKNNNPCKPYWMA